MPDLTPRLGLKKPKANEIVSRQSFNENYDIIDEKVATKSEFQAHTSASNPHNITPSLIGAVKNAGGVVQAQVGTLSARPSAGVVGRIYIASDTKAIYYDNGSTWVQVATLSWNDLTNKPSSFTPSAHASTHKTGGTDVITPADIGAAVNVVYTATIQAANWSGSEAPFSQSVSVSGILSTDTPIIDVVMSGTYGTDIERSSQWNYVYRAVTGANSITFYAKTKPTIDLPVQIKVVR